MEPLAEKLENWKNSNPENEFSPQIAYDGWCEAVIAATSKCCRKAGSGGRPGNRWWSAEYAAINKKCKPLRRKAQRKRDVESKNQYLECRAEARRVKRKAEAENWEKFCGEFTMESAFDMMKKVRPRPKLPDTLKGRNNELLSDPEEISQEFCEYFSKISDHLPAARIPECQPTPELQHPAFSSDITLAEVQAHIKDLKLKKAPGLDGIFTFMLIKGGEVVAKSLLHSSKTSGA